MMLIDSITNNFHEVYYNSKVWMWTNFMGVPCYKCPLDLWVYQEIMNDTKPDIIIETGTGVGGTTLFLSLMMEMLGKGLVITIDISKRIMLSGHNRILDLVGDSVSDKIVREVKAQIQPDSKVMVILDSDHTKAHVLKELEIYSQLVTVGNYLIVEDTNINGHPVESGWGPGPLEALIEWQNNPYSQNFKTDMNRQKFGLTFNPNGYLLRVK